MIMASRAITLWQIDGETMETVTDSFFFFCLQNYCEWRVARKLKDTCSLEE